MNRFGLTFGIGTYYGQGYTLPPPAYAPLDDWRTSLLGAFSVARRLNRLYTGPLFTVRRSTDNAPMDITWDSSEWADEVALLTFLNGASGYVTAIYDQSLTFTPNKALRQTTDSKQMRIVNNGVPDRFNGRLSLYADGPDNSQGYIGDTITGTSSTKYSCFVHAQCEKITDPSIPTVFHVFGISNNLQPVFGAPQRFGLVVTTNDQKWGIYNSLSVNTSISTPSTNNSLISIIFDGTSATIRDGTLTSAIANSNALLTQRFILGNSYNTTNASAQGTRVSEAVVWGQTSGIGNSDQTANETAIRANLTY
jgi:hypothetical protein